MKQTERLLEEVSNELNELNAMQTLQAGLTNVYMYFKCISNH